jgi:hypothetical protein
MPDPYALWLPVLELPLVDWPLVLPVDELLCGLPVEDVPVVSPVDVPVLLLPEPLIEPELDDEPDQSLSP